MCFLGVSYESKVYKLFNPITNNVIIRKDVVFEEEKSWNWQDGYEKNNIIVLN